MRNLRLYQILEHMAWERGHSAGQDEVDNILAGLVYDLQEIDNMLPYTMPPKFKVGDKVNWDAGYAGEVLRVDTCNEPLYDVMFNHKDLNTTIHQLKENSLSLLT